ncbi:LysR family transcriptional regulator [Intrasporangium oryzae NRRL B-24470]|uniref:LysR family transcriptional regulator n=1 Tax=Intrasporangium oryzae NRRL B-24470 TaxID=1386089 RepID=W9GA71_9MICO|nr:LysR family transcriptional regulator [Intrasporangium oryzae]EWT02970.1 LysR family transcriptional regulator [Intrasporangium oryzae NRRL B-24470]
MIDPIALRSLVAVEQLGSVGAAATALDYTPSAVSQQIKRLEAQTGVQLLERHGRGVLLTESGRTLCDSARDLLSRMERLEARLHRASGETAGTVRLATFATAYRGLVVGAIGTLRRAAPGVVLRPDEIDPWDAVDAVAAGTHDLALVHNWEPLPLAIPDHLEVRHLGRDRADVLVHADHPLAARTTIAVTDVLDEAWASVAPGSICHQWLQKMYADVGRAPRIAHVALEFATHVALVANGEAIALVPRLGRGPLPDGVVAVPIVKPVSERTVSLVWRGTMTASPALAAAVEALAAEASRDLTAV